MLLFAAESTEREHAPLVWQELGETSAVPKELVNAVIINNAALECVPLEGSRRARRRQEPSDPRLLPQPEASAGPGDQRQQLGQASGSGLLV